MSNSPEHEGGALVGKHEGGALVDMSWDPITRIVGSLGIHTKIDFAQKKGPAADRSPAGT